MTALKVLHVDDEPDIRELVEISLRLDPEISVKSCESGSEGLAAATSWSPGLILLDVMMPVKRADRKQHRKYQRQHGIG